MALQLPYTVFGLGSTPNFVEHLTVGISSLTINNVIVGYKKEWPQIIPNSQLVISPNPRDYTYK
jgi:integrin alpha FG-GAP repeat containing protein 1